MTDMQRCWFRYKIIPYMSNNSLWSLLLPRHIALHRKTTQINRLGSIVRSSSSRAFITLCLSSQSVGNWVRSVDDEVGELHSTVSSRCVLHQRPRGKAELHTSLFTAPSCHCMHKLCACRTPAKSIAQPPAAEIYRQAWASCEKCILSRLRSDFIRSLYVHKSSGADLYLTQKTWNQY